MTIGLGIAPPEISGNASSRSAASISVADSVKYAGLEHLSTNHSSSDRPSGGQGMSSDGAKISPHSRYRNSSWAVLPIKFLASWTPPPSVHCVRVPWVEANCTVPISRSAAMIRWSSPRTGLPLSSVVLTSIPYIMIENSPSAPSTVSITTSFRPTDTNASRTSSRLGRVVTCSSGASFPASPSPTAGESVCGKMYPT